MPVLDQFVFQANDKDVECVDANTLIADNNGLTYSPSLLVDLFHQLQVAVANIEFVGPIYQVFRPFFWVVY